MGDFTVEPWVLPPSPDLARLAMEAADAEGVAELRAWPEAHKGGIGFGGLPPFLTWQGVKDGRHHLVLLQPREVGALVPGARMEPLPPRWLEALDLDSLARPLAHHPAFPGGAAVHVVQLRGQGEGAEVHVRTRGEAAPDLVRAVLEQVSSVRLWSFAD
ncbi:MAG TPA: hypothetical protein VJ600_00185 [Holophagaceae bacterium]|nr:hypothetical protein [Holophagaceae bacterium]